jgi:hypothetical protein
MGWEAVFSAYSTTAFSWSCKSRINLQPVAGDLAFYCIHDQDRGSGELCLSLPASSCYRQFMSGPRYTDNKHTLPFAKPQQLSPEPI